MNPGPPSSESGSGGPRRLAVEAPATAPGASPVVVGRGVLAELSAHVRGADALALVADARVWDLHGERLRALAGAAPDGLDLPAPLRLDATEEAKGLAGLGRVLDHLAEAGLSRRSCVVTFGGGVVSDLGGLAASLFKRGCAVVHLPSTLLAQVDAAIGGKTAINLAAGKNLAGTFHPPRAVLADPDLLTTLDDVELRSGLGEVLKTCLLGGEAELGALEEHAPALLARDPGALHAVVGACAAVKARVVSEDPTERGPRRALNLGHTFGHAIEHAAGYGAVPHGVAVAVGLGLALDAAARTGHLADPDLPGRVRRLSAALGLPDGLAELRAGGASLGPHALRDGLAHDKKGSVGRPEFVLPVRAGEVALGVPLPEELLAALFA